MNGFDEAWFFEGLNFASLCSLSTFWFRQVQMYLGNYLHAKRYLQINGIACSSIGDLEISSSTFSQLIYYFPISFMQKS